jgi:4a-hydroxytetrahydrobiopterin dehydratase
VVTARTPLDDDALLACLRDLPRWRAQGGSLVRVVEAPSFRKAQAWVNRIADLAEGADHHPDLEWSHRRLAIRLQTHDRKAITRLDARLAALIDEVLGDDLG